MNNTRLTFRFANNVPNNNLRALGATERRVHISGQSVTDGRWHRVEVIRYGRQAEMVLDDGGLGRMGYAEEDDDDADDRAAPTNGHAFDKTPAEVDTIQWNNGQSGGGGGGGDTSSLLFPTQRELQIVLGGGVGGAAEGKEALHEGVDTSGANHFTDGKLTLITMHNTFDNVFESFCPPPRLP